jgi:2'-5' RNA ligase
VAKSPRSEPPRARLFIALDLRPDAVEAIVGWRERIMAGREDLRPLAREALHVTLVFLGWRPEGEIEAVAAALDRVAQGAGPPRLRPLGVVPVPPRRPRLFALDLDDDGDRATRLQAGLAEALEDAGLHRREQRPFWPHLTLARVRRGHSAEPIDAKAPELGPLEAAGVTLYRSTLLPHGARYDALARIALEGG